MKLALFSTTALLLSTSIAAPLQARPAFTMSQNTTYGGGTTYAQINSRTRNRTTATPSNVIITPDGRTIVVPNNGDNGNNGYTSYPPGTIVMPGNTNGTPNGMIIIPNGDNGSNGYTSGSTTITPNGTIIITPDDGRRTRTTRSTIRQNR